jgi:hypothetical protein
VLARTLLLLHRARALVSNEVCMRLLAVNDADRYLMASIRCAVGSEYGR